MGQLTDYVREGFRRRRKPWQGGEVPDWWGLAQWGALGGVGIILLVSGIAAANGSGSSGDDTGDGPGAFPVLSGPPVTSTSGPAPSSAPTSAPSAGPTATPATGPDADFTSLDPVDVPLTGSGALISAPEGAVNLARAGALASARGQWDGIPIVGRRQTPRTRHPQATLTGRLSLFNPAVTGTSRYLFTVGTDDDGPGPSPARQVKITVARVGQGFAVQPR
jgi:hypothetical protein